VSQLGSAPVSATLNVVYLGLLPTTLGFTTWAYALARTTSGKMGATTYAVPGLVVLMSWLILGQVPRWLTGAGGALCLAGVAVSRSRPTSAAAPATAAPATAAPATAARATVAAAGGDPRPPVPDDSPASRTPSVPPLSAGPAPRPTANSIDGTSMSPEQQRCSIDVVSRPPAGQAQ
jgi:EamA-like transporter family